MPERDYLLRLIEQAAQVLAGIVWEREQGRPEVAVQGVIHGMEQLFGLSVEDLAPLDIDQILGQLTREESPENARDKCRPNVASRAPEFRADRSVSPETSM